jgi:hypothetical protein
VSFAAITLCIASQRVFVVAVYFVITSVLKLLDIPSLNTKCLAVKRLALQICI